MKTIKEEISVCPLCGQTHKIITAEEKRKTRHTEYIVHYLYCENVNEYFTDEYMQEANYIALKNAQMGISTINLREEIK